MWPQRVLAVHTILGAQGLPPAPALVFRPTPGTPLTTRKAPCGRWTAQSPSSGEREKLPAGPELLDVVMPPSWGLPALRPFTRARPYRGVCPAFPLYPSLSPEHGFSSRG